MQYYHVGHNDKPATLWAYTNKGIEYVSVDNGDDSLHADHWSDIWAAWGRYDGNTVSLSSWGASRMLLNSLRQELQSKWPHAKILEFTG
jgi:hypothetical protein